MRRRALGTVPSDTAPAEDDIVVACAAGFRSVDHGEPFGIGFVETLRGRGYAWDPGSDCVCVDLGRHGHTAACRWVRTGNPT